MWQVPPGRFPLGRGPGFSGFDSVASITESQGGTGNTTYTIGDILIAAGVTNLDPLPAGAVDSVLTSNGPGVAPSYRPVPLSPGGTGTGTNGFAWMANGVGVPTTYQGFKQSGGAASVVRTWNDKVKDIICILDFGVVGDGSDETIKIQAALNFIGNNPVGDGASLYFPGGRTYGATALTFVFPNKRLRIYGDGQSTFFQMLATSGTLFFAQCARFEARDMTVLHGTQNASTSGWFFEMHGGKSTLENIHFFNGYSIAYWGHENDMGGAINIVALGMKADGFNCDVSHNFPTTPGIAQHGNMHFDRILMQATSTNINGIGMRLTSGDGIHVTNSIFAGFQQAGLLAAPIAAHSYLANILLNDVICDGAGGPATQGSGFYFSGLEQFLMRILMDNCWAGAISNGSGVRMSKVHTLTWVQGTSIDNGTYGIVIDSDSREIAINNVVVTGNGQATPNVYPGILVFDTVDQVKIKDCRCGATYNASDNTRVNTQRYGIHLTGVGTTNYELLGNDVTENVTGGILDLCGPGGKRVVRNNMGHNPIGFFTIPMGASPSSYTAGASYETVYIAGGVINFITVDGQTLATAVSGTPAVIALSPGQVMVTSYSVIPDIHISNVQ